MFAPTHDPIATPTPTQVIFGGSQWTGWTDESISEARKELAAYFGFYSTNLRHQGLENRILSHIFFVCTAQRGTSGLMSSGTT